MMTWWRQQAAEAAGRPPPPALVSSRRTEGAAKVLELQSANLETCALLRERIAFMRAAKGTEHLAALLDFDAELVRCCALGWVSKLNEGPHVRGCSGQRL